jgi:hypothetical protein
LEADNGVRVCVQDTFGEKRGTDCGRGVGEGPEGRVDVAVDEGGFADALGAEDDDFGFEGAHGAVESVGVWEVEVCRRMYLLAARVWGYGYVCGEGWAGDDGGGWLISS